jgi:hypothetical protein
MSSPGDFLSSREIQPLAPGTENSRCIWSNCAATAPVPGGLRSSFVKATTPRAASPGGGAAGWCSATAWTGSAIRIESSTWTRSTCSSTSNRKASAANDTNGQREATELLWAAFLADLRHGFRHGRRAGERSFNCIILLDNVDTPEGVTFLEELVAARRKQTAYQRQDADPLTVVATSRGTLVERVIEFGDSTGDGDWLDEWWHTAMLDDLSGDEVSNMVAAVELRRGSRRRVTAMIYQFTQGHPSSTQLLLDVVAESRWTGLICERCSTHRSRGSSRR